MNLVQKPSPNFNSKDRNGNDWRIVPKLIVIHWTAGSYQGSIGWFLKKESQVSSHFIVNDDGSEITQMVDLDRRAWHCGGSWHSMLGSDTNAETIGIEIVGPPSFVKKSVWPPSQIDAVVELCKWVKSIVPTIVGIVDHSTIDPIHKLDVKDGKGVDLFPWADLVLRTGLVDCTLNYEFLVRSHFNLK